MPNPSSCVTPLLGIALAGRCAMKGGGEDGKSGTTGLAQCCQAELRGTATGELLVVNLARAAVSLPRRRGAATALTSHTVQAMLLFLAGFAAGTFITGYLLFGADRESRDSATNAAAMHADKWKHQRPLPPI